jgi:hypothetical protein
VRSGASGFIRAGRAENASAHCRYRRA